MKNKDRKIKRLLAGPYMIWSAGFIIIPLLMILDRKSTRLNSSHP